MAPKSCRFVFGRSLNLASWFVIWQFFSMATRKKSKKTTKAKASLPTERKRKKDTPVEKIRRLEEQVGLLFRVALRGHLLPEERRQIKKYLNETEKKVQKRSRQSKKLRCPACRSPLEQPNAQRCPWCSLLLTGAHLKRGTSIE